MQAQEVRQMVEAKLGDRATEEQPHEGLEWELEEPNGRTLSLRWLPSKPDLLVLNDPASPVIGEVEDGWAEALKRVSV